MMRAALAPRACAIETLLEADYDRAYLACVGAARPVPPAEIDSVVGDRGVEYATLDEFSGSRRRG